MRVRRVALVCLWSVALPALLVTGVPPGVDPGGAFHGDTKPRTPFKHFSPVSSPGRKRGIVGSLLLPCMHLCEPLNAAWRACVSRWEALQQELSGISMFLYEQMDALVGGRDPVDFDTLKQHHDTRRSS